MGSILYILAVILVIGWLVGFFAFHAGGIIHVLLVLALIAIVIRAYSRQKHIKNYPRRKMNGRCFGYPKVFYTFSPNTNSFCS